MVVQQQQPQVVYQQPQWQPQPQQPRRGGNGGAPRRGRGGRGRRGRGQGPISTAGGGSVLVRDTEMFAPVANKLTVVVFNPGPAELPRLKQHEVMYQRYRINSVTIKFCPATATTDTGSVYMAIMPGKESADVKTRDDILKMRPSRCVAVWQPATISVGQTIDSSRFMMCGDVTHDGVAFCLYYFFGNATVSGHFQVSYNIEFAYPKVF